jgi:hypothetical protein
LSQTVEKYKQILQDVNASQKKKASAVRGLIVAGISQTTIKAWMLRGTENGAELSSLKWIVSPKSGAIASQRRHAVLRLLELGISSQRISEWVRQWANTRWIIDNYKVKQIIPAPGWRALYADAWTSPSVCEVGVAGWGLIEFDQRNPDRDETEVHLLVTCPPNGLDFVALPAFAYEDTASAVRVFAPHEEITEEDKQELEQTVREERAAFERERQAKASAA